MSSDINSRLLSAVSRSFYLSLRFLPAQFRAAVSTAYLIARATDTVADTAQTSGEHRLRVLEMMGQALDREGGAEYGELTTVLKKELAPSQAHKGEQELLTRFEEVMLQFDSLSFPEKDLVREVMGKIIRGQRLDLERFDCKVSSGTVTGKSGIPALPDEAALMEYAYLVAGCVGEFWTKLGYELYGEGFSSAPEKELLTLGRRYGQALQLINILRDRREDEERGRQYIPDSCPVSLYQERAVAWLDEGLLYAEKLHSFRLRLATGLPALIGHETLDLLKAGTGGQKPKIPRKKVYSLLLRAVRASAVPGGWAECLRSHTSPL